MAGLSFTFYHAQQRQKLVCVTLALFVLRKVNSRNLFFLFSNVWQSSGNLVKEKLISVNKNSLLYPLESVFLSLSKGKHFPIFTDKTI